MANEDTPQSSVNLYCQAFRRWQIECSLTVHTLNHYKWLAYNAFLQQISPTSRPLSLSSATTNSTSNAPPLPVVRDLNNERRSQQRTFVEAPLGIIGIFLKTKLIFFY